MLRVQRGTTLSPSAQPRLFPCFPASLSVTLEASFPLFTYCGDGGLAVLGIMEESAFCDSRGMSTYRWYTFTLASPSGDMSEMVVESASPWDAQVRMREMLPSGWKIISVEYSL